MVVCPLFDRTTRVRNRVVDLGLATCELIIVRAARLVEAQRGAMAYRTDHYLCFVIDIVECAAFL